MNVKSMSPYPTLQVANTILGLSFKKGNLISPLKLQKLTYLLHGWHLACFDKPATQDEPDAWKYGPVYPEIYHSYKIFGSIPISKENWELYGPVNAGTVYKEDKNFYDLLDDVWELYSPYSGIYLSNLTHQNDTPWYLAMTRKNTKLMQQEIKQHFTNLMNE